MIDRSRCTAVLAPDLLSKLSCAVEVKVDNIIFKLYPISFFFFLQKKAEMGFPA
jgi:hypothetical protein